MAPQRSSRDREGIGRRGDVVDAEYGRPALEPEDVRGDGGEDALVRVLAVQEPPEEALARGAEQHREAEGDDLAEAVEELEVVVDRLAEADAGIDGDALLGDAFA